MMQEKWHNEVPGKRWRSNFGRVITKERGAWHDSQPHVYLYGNDEQYQSGQMKWGGHSVAEAKKVPAEFADMKPTILQRAIDKYDCPDEAEAMLTRKNIVSQYDIHQQDVSKVRIMIRRKVRKNARLAS